MASLQAYIRDVASAVSLDDVRDQLQGAGFDDDVPDKLLVALLDDLSKDKNGEPLLAPGPHQGIRSTAAHSDASAGHPADDMRSDVHSDMRSDVHSDLDRHSDQPSEASSYWTSFVDVEHPASASDDHARASNIDNHDHVPSATSLLLDPRRALPLAAFDDNDVDASLLNLCGDACDPAPPPAYAYAVQGGAQGSTQGLAQVVIPQALSYPTALGGAAGQLEEMQMLTTKKKKKTKKGVKKKTGAQKKITTERNHTAEKGEAQQQQQQQQQQRRPPWGSKPAAAVPAASMPSTYGRATKRDKACSPSAPRRAPGTRGRGGGGTTRAVSALNGSAVSAASASSSSASSSSFSSSSSPAKKKLVVEAAWEEGGEGGEGGGGGGGSGVGVGGRGVRVGALRGVRVPSQSKKGGKEDHVMGRGHHLAGRPEERNDASFDLHDDDFNKDVKDASFEGPFDHDSHTHDDLSHDNDDDDDDHHHHHHEDCKDDGGDRTERETERENDARPYRGSGGGGGGGGGGGDGMGVFRSRQGGFSYMVDPSGVGGGGGSVYPTTYWPGRGGVARRTGKGGKGRCHVHDPVRARAATAAAWAKTAKRAIQRRRRRGGTKEFKDGTDGNDGKEGVANSRDHSVNSTFDVTQMIRNEHRRGAESHERVRRLVRQHTRALGAAHSRVGREYVAPTERRRDDVRLAVRARMLQLAADNPMEGHRPNTGASKAKWGLGAGSDGNGLAKSLQAAPNEKTRHALRWRVRQQMLGVRPSASSIPTARGASPSSPVARPIRAAWD